MPPVPPLVAPSSASFVRPVRGRLARAGPLAPVTTMLAPGERPRVDAAGAGLYYTLHRDSLDDVRRDLREHRASAVLFSVSRCAEGDDGRVATLVREFPSVPAVALLTQLDSATPQAVLALGRSGVHTLVDVRHAAGWQELRDLLRRTRADALEARTLASLAADLAGAPPDCLRFFTALFGGGAGPGTVRALARELGVVPSTLMSRFYRSQLPPPKRYLALSRLVRAAFLFENPGLSVATVANHLEYSSPQSFGRHVRGLLRLTAVQFRERYDGDGMFQRFRDELVLPYLARLRRFAPLQAWPGWVRGCQRYQGGNGEETVH